MVNGNSAQVMEQLRARSPEALAIEALTLEEIFVSTLQPQETARMTRTAVLSPALSKEIRALLPLWGASIAALAAAFVWRMAPTSAAGPMLALSAYVVGSLAIGAQSVGQEYAYRTLPMLLSQPPIDGVCISSSSLSPP